MYSGECVCAWHRVEDDGEGLARRAEPHVHKVLPRERGRETVSSRVCASTGGSVKRHEADGQQTTSTGAASRARLPGVCLTSMQSRHARARVQVCVWAGSNKHLYSFLGPYILRVCVWAGARASCKQSSFITHRVPRVVRLVSRVRRLAHRLRESQESFSRFPYFFMVLCVCVCVCVCARARVCVCVCVCVCV